MEKRIIWLAVSLVIFIFSPAHAFTLTPAQSAEDLPGCDYKNFVLPGGNNTPNYVLYDVCMDACGLDSSCQAWNFDPRSGKPTCFLKTVPLLQRSPPIPSLAA
jgi:hypothetical protein